MTIWSERSILNTDPKRSVNACHNRNVKTRKEETQPVAATVLHAHRDNAQLDLSSLPTRRRVTVALPPQLIQKLDATVKARGLNRSFLVRCALEPLLAQMEMLESRARLFESPLTKTEDSR